MTEKKIYQCNVCEKQYVKFQGKCDNCNEWNTISECVISKKKENYPNIPKQIQNIEIGNIELIKTSDDEFNKLLGGGITRGSLVLVGGDPGIGKSTLVLQLLLNLNEIKTLYISGEESEEQVAIRANRIKIKNKQCFIVHASDINEVNHHITTQQPILTVIDSIQTITNEDIDGSMGSVSQIKDITNQLLTLAKTTNTTIIIIGHINKEGLLAGPKVLEHMVDVVLLFEGDSKNNYRILRSVKNRFGHTPEIAIYTMKENGLFPINNPSSFLLSSNYSELSGVAIGIICEGQRAILIEIQALIGVTNYTTPQRVANGFDPKRLSILIAILEKKIGLKLANKDVFVNIVGGMTIHETSLDLAICMAIVSSYFDIIIPRKHCFSAEVGLCGELRTVPFIKQRIDTAIKYGFDEIIISDEQCTTNSRNVKHFSTLEDIIGSYNG